MKAQMKMARSVGADFVAIVGAQELAEQGAVTLRRLADGGPEDPFPSATWRTGCAPRRREAPA